MMRKKHVTRVLAALLILGLLFVMAGCQKRGGATDDSSSGDVITSSSSDTSSSMSEEKPEGAPEESMLKKILAAFENNDDTIGWLFMPNTTIDESVVQSYDNQVYLRLNVDQKYDWYGCYFADYENKFEGGKLSKNTIIYGHSMDDNPDGLKFSQLKKWLDPEFAKNNPYIYFSTPEKDLVYQIFSVMYTSKKFNYVEADPNTTNFLNIINEARKASQHNYTVEVTASDSIITLSTCTYIYGKDNTNQRFVIMGRLLRPGEAMKPTVELEKNPDPKKPNV